MRDVISGCTCFVCVLLRFDKKLFYPFVFKNQFLRLSLCLCVVARPGVKIQHFIGCLPVFGCVFLV